MKIYSVSTASNDYQQFLPEDDSIWASGMLSMDCKSKLESWVPPAVRIYNPKLVEGDFLGYCPGAIAIGERAEKLLLSLLERSGELLPFACNDRSYWLLNVLECVDCLDHEKTEWVYGKSTGKPIEIKNYEFNPSLVPEVSFFKIPETSKGSLLMSSGMSDPEDEVFHHIGQSKLTGLKLELIWQQKDVKS